MKRAPKPYLQPSMRKTHKWIWLAEQWVLIERFNGAYKNNTI